MDIHVGLKLIPYRMLQPIKPTIKEDDKLFSFSHITEALDNVSKHSNLCETKTI